MGTRWYPKHVPNRKTNVTLIKHIPHKCTIMNIWENLQIYKHKTQNKLIPEQIQINTKPVSYTHLDVYKRQVFRQ